MNKITKALCIVLVAAFIIGTTPSYAAQTIASTTTTKQVTKTPAKPAPKPKATPGPNKEPPKITTEISLDGTLEVLGLPRYSWVDWAGEKDYTPTLVKGKDGVYTLTIYEGTTVKLGGTVQEDLLDKYMIEYKGKSFAGIGLSPYLDSTDRDSNSGEKIYNHNGIKLYASDVLYSKLKPGETAKKRLELCYAKLSTDFVYTYYGKSFPLDVVVIARPIMKIPTDIKELSLDGTFKVIKSPNDYWEKYTDDKTAFMPTLAKGEDGMYTLTMYEGTEVELGGTVHKGLEIDNKERQGSSAWVRMKDGSIVIEAGKTITIVDRKAKKTAVKDKMTLSYVFHGMRFDEDKTYFGKSIPLNVITLPKDAEVDKQIPKILKKVGYKESMTDIEKMYLVKRWLDYNWEELSNGGIADDCQYNENNNFTQYLNRYLLSADLHNKTGLFVPMCRSIGMSVIYMPSSYDQGLGGGFTSIGRNGWCLVQIKGKWYQLDIADSNVLQLKGTNDKDFVESHGISSKDQLRYLKEEKITLSKEDYVWTKEDVERLYSLYSTEAKKEFEEGKEAIKLGAKEWAAKILGYSKEQFGYTEEEFAAWINYTYTEEKELVTQGFEAWCKGHYKTYEHFVEEFKLYNQVE